MDILNLEDVISEVIACAMETFNPERGTPWKWCSVIASRRGMDLWASLTGRKRDESTRPISVDFFFEDGLVGFTPVPGWTSNPPGCAPSDGVEGTPSDFDVLFQVPGKQNDFWALVAGGYSPSDAAREVGVSRESTNYYKKQARKALAERSPVAA